MLTLLIFLLAAQPAAQPNTPQLAQTVGPLASCPDEMRYAIPPRNLLSNPGFEIGQNGIAALLSGPGSMPSHAHMWSMFLNSQGGIDTHTLPSTAPGGGARMMKVNVKVGEGGIMTPLATESSGERVAYASVLVETGKVCMGIGMSNNNACTGPASTKTGVWERLKACTNGPSGLFFVRSVGGSAKFYVDLARVNKQP